MPGKGRRLDRFPRPRHYPAQGMHRRRRTKPTGREFDVIRQRRICATMPHHFELAATDEAYRSNRRQIETFTRMARPAPRTQVITIPVVVHVIYREDDENISDLQILSQIEVLNDDFRFRNSDRDGIPKAFQHAAGDALIEFVLAPRDPEGQPSTGITRTKTGTARFSYDGSSDATILLDKLIKLDPAGVAAWPRDDYLNLWVCPLDDGLLGYAQFPGGDAATDGVVIRTTAFGKVGNVIDHYNLGRTCVHEVGHWLNLLHIWGDDAHGCQRSDAVADTPNQGGPNEGAPVYPKISCNNAPHGDMFMNYMDYVDDAAMFMFSRGQIERMNATLAGPRASLALSNALTPKAIESAGQETQAGDGKLLFALAGQPQKNFDGVDWV